LALGGSKLQCFFSEDVLKCGLAVLLWEKQAWHDEFGLFILFLMEKGAFAGSKGLINWLTRKVLKVVLAPGSVCTSTNRMGSERMFAGSVGLILKIPEVHVAL